MKKNFFISGFLLFCIFLTGCTQVLPQEEQFWAEEHVREPGDTDDFVSSTMDQETEVAEIETLHAHEYLPATCMAPAACSLCGITNGEKLEHTWTDATCTAPAACSLCGITNGEKLEHSWNDATCTAPAACSLCGITNGEKLEHTWTDATCTAPAACSLCGITNGEKLEHSWNDATCTAPAACSLCGITNGEKLEHTWTDATCTAPAACSLCGITSGEKLEHTYDQGKCKFCEVSDPDYNPQTQTVWIPKSGKKYHSNPSCSNMKNPSETLLSDAVSAGYAPCKKCYG